MTQPQNQLAATNQTGGLISASGFPEAEFEARLDKAQRAMAAADLDALLFTTEAEMRYFTGFRTPFWLSPTRPWFLIVPASGKPIAIIPEIGAVPMAASWADDIRTWSSPHPDDDGVSLLLEALAGKRRIGLLMGRESYLRMPLADFNRLRDSLRCSEFIDSTPLMRQLRMVKSSAEIGKIAAICSIASAAFGQAKNLFHEGLPLDAAFRAFRIELLNQGAEDVPYLVGGAGQGGYGDIISPPDQTPLKKGDIFMLDTGATREGYFCDFDRNYAIGQADDSAKQAHATLYRATEAALKAARPGIRCNDLHAIMNGVIGGAGGSVGRFGHGLGMQLTEHPSIASFDDTVLAAGMVITLEPSLQIGPGKIMVHEENIVIQDGPARLLTKRESADLRII